MVLRSPGRTAVSTVLAALLVVLPVVGYHQSDPLFALVDPEAFLAVSFLATMLLTWFIATTLAPDRAEFAFVWLIIPLVTLPFVQQIWFPGWETSPYPVIGHAIIMIGAGLLGVGLDVAAKHLTGRFHGYLSPIATHKLLLIAIVLLVPIAAAGYSYATPPETTVTDIDPVFACGDLEDYPDRVAGEFCPVGLIHSFAIGLEPSPNTQLISVETPGGATFERWFDPVEMRGETATVFLPAQSVGMYETGTYTVRIESIWGQTVDVRTVDIDRHPTFSIEVVEVRNAAVTEFDMAGTYAGDFAIDLDPFVTVRGDLDIEVDRPFSFDGDGTDTVTATVVDDEGEPTRLDPGVYTVDLWFRPIDVTQNFTIEVPE